jgi:hypothetical protein
VLIDPLQPVSGSRPLPTAARAAPRRAAPAPALDMMIAPRFANRMAAADACRRFVPAKSFRCCPDYNQKIVFLILIC